MSLKLSFNEALAHLMIAKGSVANQFDPNQPYWRQERFGSYYHNRIEGNSKATLALWERLTNGAQILYDKCGPSDFGQENRFNGTFTDTQLIVRYCLFNIILDDAPDEPITLVAGMGELNGSFVKTLELLSDIGSFEEAIDALTKRVEYHTRCGIEHCYCSIGIPTLEKYYEY